MTNTNSFFDGMHLLKRSTSHCKTLLHNRRWQLFPSRIQSTFRVVHPPSVPRTLHWLSTLWHSCSPPEPEYSPPAVSHGSLVRAVCCSQVATSRAILLQPVPSKLLTTIVDLSLTQHEEVLAPSTTHAVTYNTTLSQSWTHFRTTSRFTVFGCVAHVHFRWSPRLSGLCRLKCFGLQKQLACDSPYLPQQIFSLLWLQCLSRKLFFS